MSYTVISSSEPQHFPSSSQEMLSSKRNYESWYSLFLPLTSVVWWRIYKSPTVTLDLIKEKKKKGYLDSDYSIHDGKHPILN